MRSLSVINRNNARALAACIVLAVVCGCAGTVNPAPFTRAGASALAVSHPTPNIGSKKVPPVLVYITDSGTSELNLYSYPSFKLYKTLTLPGAPACADAAGDVWFIQGQELVEYAHGGTTPVRALQDPGEYPVSCAVSSKTGTLAVANIISTSDGPGSISLYRHAKGTPTIVQGTGRFYFITYDDRDNIFGDGENNESQFALFELPNKSVKIESIALKGATIEFPGDVQYEGNVLNIGDQDGAVIYESRVKGSTATVTGHTSLTGAIDVVSYAIYKNRVICPDAGSAEVEVYAYPKGGDPVKVVAGLSEPTGVVVSAVSK
jgi:hypothetical protein